MRVLQLCNKPPFPTADGGTIAMHALTEGLLDAGHTVKVLTVETAKHPLKKDKLPEKYTAATKVESVFLDTAIRSHQLLLSYLQNKLYIIDRFNSTALAKRVGELLTENEYDIVLLESLFVAPYINTIRKYSNAKIILRAHNVEHLIWQRLLDNTTNILKRAYLSKMVTQLKAYEISVFEKVHGVAAISSIDEATIKQLAPKAKVATVALTTHLQPVMGVNTIPASVFHLGSMDWAPNVEGIEWFINSVWPLVATNVPHAKLYLAGRNMPQSLFNKANDSIIIEGGVDNPVDYMGTKQIMVVPLFSGSGVRVKVIEGMALGKPIVATPIAVEGIAVTNNENIFIAETPEAFASAICSLLSNNALVDRTGHAAAGFIEANYRPTVVIQNLERFIASL